MCDEWKAIYSAAKERSPALAPGHFIVSKVMTSVTRIPDLGLSTLGLILVSGVGYHHLPPPREVVGRESDAVRGAAGLVPGTGVPGEEAPEAWVASVGTAVFGPTRMHVCVRGCRTPHQEGLQPSGFLDVLLSGFRAVSPSRSVTRPVPTEAVSIRRGRFPRLDSHSRGHGWRGTTGQYEL